MDVISYLLGKQAGGGSKPPVLQDKKVTITENGTTNVTADTGYDGLSQVKITADIPPSNIGDYIKNTIGENDTFQNFIKKIPSPIYINSKNWANIFNGNNLVEMPVIASDTSQVTNMDYMFANSFSIKNIDLSYFDTSNVASMSGMFQYNYYLETLDISSFNFEKCVNIPSMFTSCNNLENLSFGYNLGKGYLTTQTANYGRYTLDLSSCSQLTHDSLMSVINGLYDIASAGVQPQKLKLGSTNLAKLSQAEKDMVTAKGWNLS